MQAQAVTISSRFNGPPDSGNGGYVCGIVARHIDGPASVRLNAPPQLDAPMTLEERDGTVLLLDGEHVVAEGRPAELDLDVPDPVTLEEATDAATRFRGFEEHIFSTCFVCGPDRDPSDGLRIFCGAADRREIVAAPWTPHASLAGDDGLVRSEYYWAALDCPGAFSFPQLDGAALLGELTARIDRQTSPGDPCIVTAWYLGSEGRKHYAGSAVFTQSGQPCAAAKATWIHIDRSS